MVSLLRSKVMAFVLLSSLFVIEPGFATMPPTSDHLTDKLAVDYPKMMARHGFKSEQLGIWIQTQSAEGENLLFTHNPDKQLIPASLSKLVTAAAVLNTLPPDHKFFTHLLADGAIKNGTLNGSLYLKGGGDPSFVSETMWFLVNVFTRAGVRKIAGDLIVDDTRFDNIRFGEGRQKERVDRAYDAPLGAMSMNWNAVNVHVRPGLKPGDALNVVVDVASPYIKLRNLTKTAPAGRGKKITVERTREKGFLGDVITVRGSMSIGQEEAVYFKSISQPDLWSGYNLLEFLKQRGIQLTGTVRTGQTPSKAKVLAEAESKPLAAIVADMSKWSNNYVAEMLVKNLGAEGTLSGTMDAGLVHVQNYLKSVGLKDGEYVFVNASGLTRQNRFSVKQIATLLQASEGDFSTFPEFLTSLPIGGTDGTLKDRMKKSAAERWVRAKTGLLTGVVGLAGFAGRRNGKASVRFVFLYNGAGREDHARRFFDELAAYLSDG